MKRLSQNMRERVRAKKNVSVARNTQGIYLRLVDICSETILRGFALYCCWRPKRRRDRMVQGFRQVNGTLVFEGKEELIPSPLTLIRHSVSQLMDGWVMDDFTTTDLTMKEEVKDLSEIKVVINLWSWSTIDRCWSCRVKERLTHSVNNSDKKKVSLFLYHTLR